MAAGKRGHQRHLGSYPTAEVAAAVYDRAVIKLRGVAAELNFAAANYAPENDDFMKEHGSSNTDDFLELLRARFSDNVQVLKQVGNCTSNSSIHCLPVVTRCALLGGAGSRTTCRPATRWPSICCCTST